VCPLSRFRVPFSSLLVSLFFSHHHRRSFFFSPVFRGHSFSSLFALRSVARFRWDGCYFLTISTAWLEEAFSLIQPGPLRSFWCFFPGLRYIFRRFCLGVGLLPTNSPFLPAVGESYFPSPGSPFVFFFFFCVTGFFFQCRLSSFPLSSSPPRGASRPSCVFFFFVSTSPPRFLFPSPRSESTFPSLPSFFSQGPIGSFLRSHDFF